jgi:2-octaprenyl-6-methoxyphenol hydroxylase
MMERRGGVIVVGGGLAGLAAALALESAGASVTLLDARPKAPGKQKQAADARTTAVLAPGVRFLEKLGVWHRVAAEATPLARLRIVTMADAHGPADAEVTFSAREIGAPAFGYNIPNDRLHAALLAAFRQRPRAGLELGMRLVDLDLKGERARLACADGSTFEADLVVAADGRESTVRALADVPVDRRELGQTAIVTRFSHARPHHQTSTELHRPGGPFAMVPLPGRQSSLVWVERTATAERLMALDEAGFAAALDERVRPWLGATSDVAPPKCFELVNQRARRLTGRRLVLIGEAAHALSPLGAQGFNLSLRDAEALGRIAARTLARGETPGSRDMLESYARERAPDIRARVLGVETLGQLVDSGLPPMRHARAWGLRLLGGIGPARRRVMRGMMAPVGAPH